MLRHPNKFYKSIEQELTESGESYESYCYNVYHSKVWGDDLVAAAFSDMWNVAISIVSPMYKYPVDLWHNKDNPEISLNRKWRVLHGTSTQNNPLQQQPPH